MSPRLTLQFLGLPQILLDDRSIATDRRKAVALLAYLAVNHIEHARQKYSRESLSALFWPDYEQSKAFSNLRRTIWEVNQALGEGWLIAEREVVQLNPEAEIELDVACFQDLLAQARQQNDPALRIPLLLDATKLYRNHFLAGFSLKDASPFNEWAYTESEELRHQLGKALATLTEDYCALGHVEKAVPHARRLIALEPLNESAHRQLMEVYLQAGQPGAALKQYQTCEQMLRKELNLDPQPETRALYKKIRKGDMKTGQPEKRTETIPPKHNLPSPLSSFIGREKEQEEIINILRKNRLVTLAGVGGIGKTRLALRVGQELLPDYPDGVWFIRFDSLSNAMLIPQAIASVFDLQEGPDRPISEVLINVLRQKSLLLIFDNCEHLLDSCAQLITNLLTSCPHLKILTTSREILNMEGEATYYVSSLSIPEHDNASLEIVTQSEAVQLFTERAGRALSSFRLAKENVESVDEICRKVEGIPLAIELAAARVDVLGVKEISKQLHDSFALLANEGRRTLPRHQTLRASMDWSWSLLTESERIFLRQLSVFAGGWTLESARAVCEGDILDLTSALVKKSLIRVDQKLEGKTRYRFHQIVRQYLQQKLLEAAEGDMIQTRHLQYFLRLSEQAEIELRGPAQVEWMSRLREERDNLRAALEWAAKTDTEAGLSIASRMHWYWEGFDVREGARWLAELIQSSGSTIHPLTKAKALLVYGQILGWNQQHLQARSAAQACLGLFRALGDRQGEIECLLLLASIGSATDQPKQLRQQALALSQALGDRWREAWALSELGWSDSVDKRIIHWEQARTLWYETGDWGSLVRLLGHLGNFYLLNGNFMLAQQRLAEAVHLNHQLQHKGIEAYLLLARGRMAMIQGDYAQAHAQWEEALNIAEELGSHMKSLWCRSFLGYLALYEGNVIEAHNIFTEMARQFFNDKDEIFVVFNLEGLAALYVAIGKLESAAQLIGWADSTREKIGDPRPLLEQADVDKIIGACLAKIGEVEFSVAYEMGQKMTLDEAVAFALEENK